MYLQLKRLVRGVLPKSLMTNLEPVLRQIYALGYKGNQVHCGVCETSFRQFIAINNGRDSLCPKCGSLPRTRMLWRHLKDQTQLTNQPWKVLHFSPARPLKRKLKTLSSLDYQTTDYEEHLEDHNFDITNLPLEAHTFDFIICYHVMEHIIDDIKAMAELYRILKKGGQAILQVPWKEGPTYEDYTITSEEEREKHFGQKDHVRYYGKNDFVKRLSSVGFKVQVLKNETLLEENELTQYGVSQEGVSFLCQK